MKIDGSVALVTGANRGLGRVYARELVARGAGKVYGAARNPAAVTEPGVLPIALDITDLDRVAQVAAQCADVTLLVNNAGVLKYSTFTGAPDLDAAARAEMETNYFGTLRMCRAFAPVLAASGGGAIVNMLSVTSFYSNPFDASYGASKAAAWALTNGVRLELHHQHTLVVAVRTPASSIPSRHGRLLTERAQRHPRVGRPASPRRRRSRPDRGPRRRADPDRQGATITRPRADLSARRAVLGHRSQRHRPASARPRRSAPSGRERRAASAGALNKGLR